MFRLDFGSSDSRNYNLNKFGLDQFFEVRIGSVFMFFFELIGLVNLDFQF